MTTTSLFSIFADFHTEETELDFGIIELQIPQINAVPIIWDLYLNVDNSASMSDKCIDGRTKMHHIIHTIENILRILAEHNEVEINICIKTFNTVVNTITDFVKLTPENLENLIERVNKIRPNGSTNLVCSLMESKTILLDRQQQQQFPKHKQMHIQLTDGEDTVNRSKNASIFIDSISDSYYNIFIGFGSSHDGYILGLLGDNKNCEYK